MAGLPSAVVPLWQVAQVPAAMPAWFITAPVNVVVPLWHTSHDCVVTTWVAGLPIAVVPLWQVAQLPGAMPEWLNDAGIHAVVRWQESQDAVVVT